MKESFCILLGVEFINLGLAKSSSTPTGGASARSMIRNTDEKAEPKKGNVAKTITYKSTRKLSVIWKLVGEETV